MEGERFVGKPVGIEVSSSARRSDSEADLLRGSQFSRKSRPCKVRDRLSVPIPNPRPTWAIFKTAGPLAKF